MQLNILAYEEGYDYYLENKDIKEIVNPYNNVDPTKAADWLDGYYDAESHDKYMNGTL